MKWMGRLVVLVIAMFMGLASISWASPGQENWSYSATGTIAGMVMLEFGGPKNSMAIDSKGNCIFATTTIPSSTSTPNALLIKLSPAGDLIWQRTDSNMLYISAGVAVDSNDNIVVASLKKDGSNVLWHIVSYSSSGAQNWVKDIDIGYSSASSSSIFLLLTGICTDSNDNIILGGTYFSSSSQAYGYTLSLEPSNGNKNWDAKFTSNSTVVLRIATDSNDNVIAAGLKMITSSSKELEVVSYTPSGGINWKRSASGVVPCALTVDHSDNVIVGGFHATASTNRNWQIISYSPSGNINWSDSRTWTTNSSSMITDIAADSHNNLIAVGEEAISSITYNMKVLSYTPSGGVNWSKDAAQGTAFGVAIDPDDNIFVVGGDDNPANSSISQWKIVSYSGAGDKLWENQYSDAGNCLAVDVAIDGTTGNVVVIGLAQELNNVKIINYEGYPPTSPPMGHVLVPKEVRTINPAAETPDPDTGAYLGFGDVVSGGTLFKVEAQFPQYLNQGDNSTLAVKIFIAAQMPDDYSRLAYFDSSNNLKYQPPEKLSSWKASVSGEVAKTTVMPEVDVTSAFSSIPSGTHYWYTLVVPDTVPDDFAGVDWNTTPWEITVNIFEVNP